MYHLIRHIHGESELTIATWQINDGHNHSWLTYKPTAVNHGNWKPTIISSVKSFSSMFFPLKTRNSMGNHHDFPWFSMIFHDFPPWLKNDTAASSCCRRRSSFRWASVASCGLQIFWAELCRGNMGMDQYLLIPFFGGWTSINPSYFDVNRRGTRFWHTAISIKTTTSTNTFGIRMMGLWMVKYWGK